MADWETVNTVTDATLSKVNSVAKASIANIMGLTTQVVAGSPIAGYTAEAVYFDGSNDSLNRASALSGSPSDNKLITVSFWWRPDALTGTNQRILDFSEGGGNRISLFAQNTTNRFVFFAQGGPSMNQGFGSGAIKVGKWYHVLLTVDFASAANTALYLDDTELAKSATGPSGTNLLWSTWDDLDLFIRNAGEHLRGDVADMWITNEWIDLSVEANRRKFISADGLPVDLGSDGSTPTGTAALIFFKGDQSVWDAGTNSGSGGDFTKSGDITDSSNEPVEWAAHANTFDGSADYLSNTSPSGVTNTQKGIISGWIRPSTGHNGMLFHTSNGASSYNHVCCHTGTGGQWNFFLREDDETELFQITSAASSIPNNAWTHVLMAFDWSASPLTFQLYFNDVEDTSYTINVGPIGGTVDWGGQFCVGARHNDGLLKFNGDLAEVYVTNEYLDISDADNRAKFAGGSPLTPAFLGGDGSIPTGTQPLVYFKGQQQDLNNGLNEGSGGNFTMTGSVVASGNEPVVAGG